MKTAGNILLISGLTLFIFFGSGLALQESKTVKAQTVPEAPENPEMANPYGEPVQVKATAYCSCVYCCGHTHGITKSGRKAVEGLTVASNVYYGKTVIISIYRRWMRLDDFKEERRKIRMRGIKKGLCHLPKLHRPQAYPYAISSILAHIYGIFKRMSRVPR